MSNEVTVEQTFNSVNVTTPGPQGIQGPQGDQGIQGETGDTGPQGPAGADGDPSSQMERVNGGYLVINRYSILNNVVSFASGNLRGSGFWAPDNISIASIGFSTAATLPAIGATDTRFCLYSYDPVTADTVLLGQTANVNDTLTVVNTHYVRPLLTPVPLVKGQRYLAALFSTGSVNFNVPSTLIGGSLSGSGFNAIPPYAGTVTTGLSSPPVNVVTTASTQSIFVAIYEGVMSLEF